MDILKMKQSLGLIQHKHSKFLCSMLVVLAHSSYAADSALETLLSASGEALGNNKIEIAATLGQLESFKEACAIYKAESEKKGDKNSWKSKSINIKNMNVTCSGVDRVIRALEDSDSSSSENFMCRKQVETFLEVKKEYDKACGVFSSCKDAQFLRCIEAFEDIDIESSDSAADLDFLRACPYLAKEPKEDAKTELEDLEARVKDNEYDMQNLQEQLEEMNSDIGTEVSDLDTQISELEGKSQEELADITQRLSDITGEQSEKMTEMRDEVTSLQRLIRQQRNKGVTSAHVEYGKVLAEIRRECYARGLAEVQAESMRLKSNQGVQTNYLLGVAAGGMMEHLRSVANKTFNQCQKSRLFADGQKSAEMIYQSNITDIEQQVTDAAQRIQSLDQMMKTLPQETQAKLMASQNQGFTAAQTYIGQVNQLKMQKQQLMMQKSQGLMRIQGAITKLQQQQLKDEKTFRTAKSKKLDLDKIPSSAVQTREQFDQARVAYETYESSRKANQEACCRDGKSSVSGVECPAPSNKGKTSSGPAKRD